MPRNCSEMIKLVGKQPILKLELDAEFSEKKYVIEQVCVVNVLVKFS